MRYTFEDLVAVMARLRAPDGCPWDRAQTPRTLRPYLLEEAYEVLEALDAGAPATVREELGDLLLQIVFHAQMAAETGEFGIAEVVDGLTRKLIARHPHVFGDQRLATADAVKERWEQAKWEEAKRAEQPDGGEADPFAGIPRGLPSLARAQKAQERVRAMGFRWPDVAAAVAKVRSELDELETAPADRIALTDELGDVLFTLVNVAIFHRVDAEQALRDATGKFIERFRRLQALAAASGRPLNEHTLEEMLGLWQTAKRGGDGAGGGSPAPGGAAGGGPPAHDAAG